MEQNKEKQCLGIDVSKDTLDIYWLGKSYKIKNDVKSILSFIKATIGDSRQSILCVMESTGGYERAAIEAFNGSQIPVHVAHPNRVHAFAKASGHFAKTDKLDAILLYKYGKFIADKEDGDVIFDEQHQAIIALRRLSRVVEQSLHGAQCRIKQMPAFCTKYLKAEITLYEKQIEQIQKEIDDKIENHPDLKVKRDIMMSMKSVGKRTAAILLAEVPELGIVSRKEIASLVGVAPKTYQSGKKSSVGHITGGRFYARKALYMIALVASQHDSNVKARYQDLIARGKAKKIALVALMRDAIVSLNAMIKKGEKCQTLA